MVTPYEQQGTPVELTFYQIDAFANKPFEGNPAGVCPLTDWLPDEVMQSVAAENNLTATAFFVEMGGDFHIRWFSPTRELDLCGHATLASAWVVFDVLGSDQQALVFQSRSGRLIVRRGQYGLEVDFPAQPPEPCQIPP